MSDIVKLAGPEAIVESALNGGYVDVTVKVPVEVFAAAYRLLRPIMDDGSPHLAAWLTEEGRNEDDLRALLALFCHVTASLPMDTRHYLDWLDNTGVSQYLDEFAQRRSAAAGHLSEAN